MFATTPSPSFALRPQPHKALHMNKSTFCKKHVATFAVALAALPLVGHAAPAFFLNDTIIRHIPSKDLPSFRSALGSVLNGSSDGFALRWSSAHTAPSKMINVEFRSLQTAQTRSANTCRLVKADVTRSRESETWQFWFCQQEDGSWKASGSSLPG